MRLYGVVKDKNGKGLGGAVVEVKDADFSTLYSAVSDPDGGYSMVLPENSYPFVTAVKEYGEKYLEYWCQNIDLGADRELNITIDALEIYGLHVFSVKGGHNSLMVYFRPMSLKKFQSGEEDICPDIQSIEIYVDGQKSKILSQNEVWEYAADRNMRAFLLQVENPNADRSFAKLEVKVCDEQGDLGCAAIYHG